MCTVTYLPSATGCFITSSRDENAARPKAIAPAVYRQGDLHLVYPRDAEANGSWIGCNSHCAAAVLLNGAFEKHQPSPPYRKSRGLVFLDIIRHSEPEFCFLGMDLNQVEPFTLVLFINGFLYEARWDGDRKHFQQLDAALPHIWSSVTLYDAPMEQERRAWFNRWLTETPAPGLPEVYNFHRNAGNGNSAYSIFMNRNDQLLTVSITCLAIGTAGANMHYFETGNEAVAVQELAFETVNQ